jgi:hypothetical protein
LSIVRSLDADHDWTYGKGKNNYLRQQDAIQQDIDTRLLSFLGDCFFDIVAGIDWWGRLGSKDRTRLELDIAAVIINTAGVTSLVQLSSELDPATRLLSVSYVVNTIYSGVTGFADTIAASANFILTQDGIIITTEDGNPITT